MDGEGEKEQATGVNICLLSLDYKCSFTFFYIYNCINVDVQNIGRNAERIYLKCKNEKTEIASVKRKARIKIVNEDASWMRVKRHATLS